MKEHITLRILNKLNLIRFFNFNSKIKLGSRTVKIPIVKGIGFDNLLLTELWLNPIIEEIFKHKPGAFVDIGVNLGQTLIKVKSLDISRAYYGFEPNPICYYYTKELISLNEYGLCNLLPVGLYDKACLLKLFMKNSIDSTASAIEGFRDRSSYDSDIYVPVFDGDYLTSILNMDSISIIKIDVEGGELEVIRGLRKTISKYFPYILCEILPVYDESTDLGAFRKKRQDELERIIREEGYIIHRILHSGEIARIEFIDTHSDLSLCDYLFVHKSEEEKNFKFPMINTM